MFDRAILNGKAFIVDRYEDKHIYLKDGKIAAISGEILEAKETFDARGYEILPGLIDPHVHFDLDLGFIRSRDDFEHGSRAALYGGVTTIIDFLNPTSNAKDLEAAYLRRKQEAAHCLIDYHFHATIKAPDGDLEEYVLTMKRLGMRTVKLFTTYSDSGRRTDDDHIVELLKLSKKHDILVMAHIENDAMIKLDKRFTYRDLPFSRPSESETSEALKLAGFVEEHGGYLYMVHCSSGKTLAALLEKYPHLIGKNLFIESCPQYFFFTQDALNGKQGYLYTCAPPLRTIEEVNLLKKHKLTLATIGTDHCAFNIKDKLGRRLMGKPLGIGGIEHSYSLMRTIYGEEAINRMSASVASLMGLSQKGSIRVGVDADLSFFISIPGYIIDQSHGRADYDLYLGLPSSGLFDHVMIRGEFVLKDRDIIPHEWKLLEASKI